MTIRKTQRRAMLEVRLKHLHDSGLLRGYLLNDDGTYFLDGLLAVTEDHDVRTDANEAHRWSVSLGETETIAAIGYAILNTADTTIKAVDRFAKEREQIDTMLEGLRDN